MEMINLTRQNVYEIKNLKTKQHFQKAFLKSIDKLIE